MLYPVTTIPLLYSSLSAPFIICVVSVQFCIRSSVAFQHAPFIICVVSVQFCIRSSVAFQHEVSSISYTIYVLFYFSQFVICFMMPSLLHLYFLDIQPFLSNVIRIVFISVLWLNPLVCSFLMSVAHLSAKSSRCVQLPACLSSCEVHTPYACLLGILPDKSGQATISNEKSSLLSYVVVQIVLFLMQICRSRNVTLLSSSFSLFSCRSLWQIRLLLSQMLPSLLSAKRSSI